MMKVINFTTITLTIVIAMVGLLIAALFFYEYRSAHQLIDHQRSLLLSSANKTLALYIEDYLSEFPVDVSALQDNWQTAPRDIFWFEAGSQIFPFLWGGDNEQRFEMLWQYYHDDAGTISTGMTESDTRRMLAQRLAQHVKAKDENAMKHALAEFLLHKENVQLLPIEEIVSWLVLLENGTNIAWSRSFVQRVLFDGWPSKTGRINAIADIYLRKNALISRGDMDIVLRYVETIAKRYELQHEAFSALSLQLYQPFEMRQKIANGFWLFELRWLLHKNDSGTMVVPAEVAMHIDSVTSLLQSQGFLAQEDRLYLQVDKPLMSLSELSLNVDKPSWQTAQKEQLYLLLFKLVFLTLSLCIMGFVLLSIINKVERKRALIETQESFVNLISHELKTPVAAIAIMAETLQKRIQKNLTPRDYTQRILTESHKLQMLVDNVLSLNQLRDSVILPKDQVDLLSLVCAVVDEMTDPENSPLVSRVDISDKVAIEANPVLFALVIRNLISNALKYNANDTVRIGIRYHEHEHLLSVSDNGIGIDRSQWQNVFQRFYRLEHGLSQAGMGLGLHLCREIMRAHGGDLAIAESGPTGTTWHIYFKTSTYHD